MSWHGDGRTFTPELSASLRRSGDAIELVSPGVGWWRNAPAPGTLVRPGMPIGELEVLGVLHRLVAPAEAVGLVVDDASRRKGAIAVEHGQRLFGLDPEAVVGAATGRTEQAASGPAGLVFVSPLSGRYYARPAPDKPAFVSVGDVIGAGQTIALLEVMKTFNRITYGGPGLPERARVLAVVPKDEDDLDAGSPILQIEPA
jgi:acetyl-CoA carboxylase biotin carboxyl carrier protein